MFISQSLITYLLLISCFSSIPSLTGMYIHGILTYSTSKLHLVFILRVITSLCAQFQQCKEPEDQSSIFPELQIRIARSLLWLGWKHFVQTERTQTRLSAILLFRSDLSNSAHANLAICRDLLSTEKGVT